MKTLAIRVERQNSNAMVVAHHLENHPNIKKVYYPGLETQSGFETAQRQMHGFGGMLSFELSEGKIDPQRFIRNLRLIRPALSLGGVETIICAPSATSHVKLSAAERHELGITDGLFRLSVGIEDVIDITSDLDLALTN